MCWMSWWCCELVNVTKLGNLIDTQQNYEDPISDTGVKVWFILGHVWVALNLIASIDADRAKFTLSYSRQYNSVMGKYRDIWNIVQRSSNSANAFKQICSDEGMIFLVCCATSENSAYEAVLTKFVRHWNNQNLKHSHVDFLIKYRRVLQPLLSRRTPRTEWQIVLGTILRICHRLAHFLLL